jgi:hypothetical protein
VAQESKAGANARAAQTTKPAALSRRTAAR